MQRHTADLLPALDRFTATLPSLRRLLGRRPHSAHEQLLRAEMLKTALRLADAFREAAALDASHTQAEAFQAAAVAAAELAYLDRRSNRTAGGH